MALKYEQGVFLGFGETVVVFLLCCSVGIRDLRILRRVRLR